MEPVLTTFKTSVKLPPFWLGVWPHIFCVSWPEKKITGRDVRFDFQPFSECGFHQIRVEWSGQRNAGARNGWKSSLEGSSFARCLIPAPLRSFNAHACRKMAYSKFTSVGQRKNLSPRRESNPWPPVHRSALTTELLGDLGEQGHVY